MESVEYKKNTYGELCVYLNGLLVRSFTNSGSELDVQRDVAERINVNPRTLRSNLRKLERANS